MLRVINNVPHCSILMFFFSLFVPLFSDLSTNIKSTLKWTPRSPVSMTSFPYCLAISALSPN